MNLSELIKSPNFESQSVAANIPFTLTGQKAWIVLSGSINLFCQPNDREQRIPFLRREQGQLMVGLPESIVLAVGTSDCQVASIAIEQLLKLDQALTTPLLEEWFLSSSLPIAPDVQEVKNLEASENQTIESGDLVGTQDLRWLSTESQAFCYGHGQFECGSLFVLAPRVFARATLDTQVSLLDFQEARARPDFWTSVEVYHRWICLRLKEIVELKHQSDQNRIEQRELAKKQALGDSLHRLAEVLPGTAERLPSVPEQGDVLLETVRLVADSQLIKVQLSAFQDPNDRRDPLTQIAQSSGFQTRLVKLEKGWWKGDVGNLLGNKDQQAVALIRKRPGKYVMVDLAQGSTTVVTKSVAATLDPEAYVFYRPLPYSCNTFSGLLKFVAPSVSKDFSNLVALSILGALMAMATPVALGVLTSTVIPSGQVTELGALGLGLALAIFVTACATLGQAITALRIGGRVDADVQAAITDRLLGLPAPFFRRFNSGDLTNRLLGFQAMVQTVTGTALSALLAGLMSSTNLLLMFYYDRYLALLGLGMVAILLSFLAICSWLDLGLQRKLARTQGELSGLVFQFIGGIAKLRVAAAQARAFDNWSKSFAERTRMVYSSGLIQAHVNSVLPIYNTASLIAFFAYLAHYRYAGLATSDFLALTSAYGAFVGSVNMAARSLTALITTVPLAERFQPILAERGEVPEDLPEPGELQGTLELKQVSFRYAKDGPLVLKNVNIKANPGEFVAIVGPSGSGKSTCFRMFVGFETPSQGSVLYDGQELSGLNMQSVRRQLGVVLQNGKLMPGSIVSNIIGSALLTVDDAWAAAEIAGLAGDIRDMPMGMHTVVSEGGSAFSGGQSQRLLIARAVVSQPKILLLDEATSALDSRTQAQVSEQLTNLRATRVVIAHRLSTIENADRIYVMKDGVVVQVGNYKELVAVPGTFQDLAKRQML